VIRVALADNSVVIRTGLRVLLESEEDIVVTGEASDGEQAVALARDTQPDVLLMDIRMPRLDGLEATRRIAADPRTTGVGILILTSLESDESVFQALRGGASGFRVKNGDVVEVLRAVRVIAAGEALLTPGATRRLVEEIASWPERGRIAPALLGELTDREREVMVLVAYGLTNVEIAKRLVISPATAKTHVSRTMVKPHARDRAQLVVLAYQTGLVVRGGALETSAVDRITSRVAA